MSGNGSPAGGDGANLKSAALDSPSGLSTLGANELADLAALLDEARLPSGDLSEPHRHFHRFDVDGPIGYGGIEGFGADRLLRSIIVLPDRRGAGLGRQLVQALEQAAREQGVRRLHLLTTTAAPFFRALGYVDTERTSAPDAIAASREFSTLCPASAAYLSKAL